MANQTKKAIKEFELIQFEPNQIVNFSKWENQQKRLVKDNPFIKVVDSKTHAIAKKRRTNLVTGRTTLQKERDDVKKELNRAKTFVADKYDGFIAISSKAETKQQQELTEYETKLAEEKEREAALEEKRINDINQLIQDCEASLDGIIDRVSFETLEDSQQSFDATVDSGQYDPEVFEERLFLFEEMVEKQQEKLNDKSVQLQIQEQTRLDNLSFEQQGKINELYREATEIIDNKWGDAMFIQQVQAVFDIDYDFGTHTDKMQSTKSELVRKANQVREERAEILKQKQEQDHQNKLLEQRNRIIQIREGMLDLVFQTDQANFEVNKQLIFEQSKTPNGLMDELIPEWEKAKERVVLSFESKATEIEEQQKKFEKRHDERHKELMSLGFTEFDGGLELGEDLSVNDDDLFEMDTIEYQSIFEQANSTLKENRIRNERLETRKPELAKLGLTDLKGGVFSHPDFPELAVTMGNLVSITDEGWVEAMEYISMRTQEIKEENKIHNERWNARKPQLEKLGLVEIENDHGGEFIFESHPSVGIENGIVIGLDDEDFTERLESIKSEIQEWKDNDAKEQERQEQLKDDKKIMIQILDAKKMPVDCGCTNDELINLWNEISKSYDEFIALKIEQIKKF